MTTALADRKLPSVCAGRSTLFWRDVLAVRTYPTLSTCNTSRRDHQIGKTSTTASRASSSRQACSESRLERGLHSPDRVGAIILAFVTPARRRLGLE